MNGLDKVYTLRFLPSLLLLTMAPPAFADARSDQVIERARELERTQLAALAGTTLTMQTDGVARSGKTDHALSATRTLGIDKDGQIRNEYVTGKVDGKVVTEVELRQATGAPAKPPHQAEALTVALAPLTASDITVSALGPTSNGGYRLRCAVHRDAAIDQIELTVDEASGRKRAATLRPAGKLVRMADRAELQLLYAADGTPAQLDSHFAAKVLWVDRAVDMRTLPISRAHQ